MKKLFKMAFMVALFFGAQTVAGAQEPMTLKECMEYAVSNSTKMRIQQADLRDAQVERRSAILEAFTPSVSAGSYAYYNFGRSVDPETNTYKSTTSFQNGYQASGSIALFNGFQAVNNIKISRTAAAMGVSRQEQTRDEICLATMEAYYNVVYYGEMMKAIEEEVAAATKAVQLARKQEQMGQKGYADVVQIEADLAAKEYRLVNARNMANDALLTLKDIMFWPLDQELAIDCSMADEAALESGEQLFAKGALDGSKEELVANALETLPAAYMAKGEMMNAKRAFNTAKWQLLPSLNLSGGWSTSYFTYPDEKGYVATPFRNQFTNNMGEYIQLSMSIPIYGRLYRQATIAKKKNAYIRATAQYDQKVREIEAEVTRAIQDKEGAQAAFVQANKQVQVQKEAYKFNTKKFEQGMISPIEYQTASGNWLSAKAEQLNALLKYYLKRSVVEYYSGVPYLEQ
ncbi:MAG: TolC family protein [Bacteroidales bacterium]|nr:TolC family protein [Bacteroidales bacterium]